MDAADVTVDGVRIEGIPAEARLSSSVTIGSHFEIPLSSTTTVAHSQSTETVTNSVSIATRYAETMLVSSTVIVGTLR
ncbi:hypothetical protein D8S78_21815 [Natrialba swarupiae]|nr:hypothetical protein [Natrialba swarupiae]